MPRPAERAAWKYRAVGWLGSGFIRSLGRTWRIQELDSHREREIQARGERLIYSFWHGHLLIPAFARRGSGTCVMISRHGDGELIAQVIDRLGFHTERGSTTRGGSGALRRMAKLEEHDLAITPDGPKGPRHQAQAGVILLAALTRRPLLPVGLAASPSWQLSSWDRFTIPKPFARVSIVFEEPMTCPPEAGEDEREELRLELERRMAAASERAEAVVTARASRATKATAPSEAGPG